MILQPLLDPLDMPSLDSGIMKVRIKRRTDMLSENTSLQSTILEEEINTLRQDTTTLQESVVRLEKATDERDILLQALTAKVTDMEDRARRDNILILNLNEGVEGTNSLAYLRENIPKWFPVFAPAPPELMRAHRSAPVHSSGEEPASATADCQLSALHGERCFA
ncbi:hypothetical protein NQD34_000467 [Periophthalmus magnuspinnatus]|nr:hypothetical protein NQD34_000467 [Periophthalmus magnuspinnatus]